MDTIFFIASKLLGILLKVETWIVLGVALTLLAALRGRLRPARAWGAATLATLLILSIFPLGVVLLQPLERQYPTSPPLDRVDGIVILGGGEEAAATAHWGQVQLNDGGERLSSVLPLAARFPDARILFSGGSGSLRDLAGNSVSGASVAERFFRENGLDPGRLILEGRSRNTAENARYSLAQADPAPGEVWLLVTSAFHMPRAMQSFETAGWTGLVPYPVDYMTSSFVDVVGWDLQTNLFFLNLAIKEWVGRLVYAMTGR
jgi:uncharacterized SAM-binding protein YcdF (DUF218 family)